ncbi:MAG: uroporphyrinogen decarboxylase family protein [Planctomycetota bacterium]
MSYEPDFSQLLRVLRRERPGRPTLFEFFHNDRLYERVTGRPPPAEAVANQLWRVAAFQSMGYDYCTLASWLLDWGFTGPARDKGASVSLNHGGVITGEASLAAYSWPDPNDLDLRLLDAVGEQLPSGMPLIAMSPGGVQENAIKLVGFEELVFALADEEDWVEEVFSRVGHCLLAYYERLVDHPAIGAVIVNDDWGFAQGPMLGVEQLRQHVFPWHQRIVARIHAAGKPAILHSCGNFLPVIDAIIDELGYDARHSYEDNIVPVEEAYERFGDRIAILGGIDVDFVCRADPAAITERARAMLERSAERGGYALGTGNSVPDYVPDEQILALLAARELIDV